MTLAGSHVVVLTAAGVYIGGTLWSSAADGSLFVMKDEICLNAEMAEMDSEWETFPKEPWQGMGEVVEDPRMKGD